MNTLLLSAMDANTPAIAAEIIRNGGLVAIPTETVYGLGANGLDETAVARIFEAKGRPQDNPLILHVHAPEAITEFAHHIPQAAFDLAMSRRKLQFSSLSRVQLCNPMDCSTPGLPAHHQLPELAQTHVC